MKSLYAYLGRWQCEFQMSVVAKLDLVIIICGGGGANMGGSGYHSGSSYLQVSHAS